MNEAILNADGTVTVVGDAGSIAGVIADRVREATPPEGPAPDPATVAIEITRADLKTHPWRLPKARVERLAQIRALRDARLLALDREANHASTGRPGQRPVPAVEADRQTLRDLPPAAEAALAGLTDTDAIDAYVPVELE